MNLGIIDLKIIKMVVNNRLNNITINFLIFLHRNISKTYHLFKNTGSFRFNYTISSENIKRLAVIARQPQTKKNEETTQ